MRLAHFSADPAGPAASTLFPGAILVAIRPPVPSEHLEHSMGRLANIEHSSWADRIAPRMNKGFAGNVAAKRWLSTLPHCWQHCR